MCDSGSSLTIACCFHQLKLMTIEVLTVAATHVFFLQPQPLCMPTNAFIKMEINGLTQSARTACRTLGKKTWMQIYCDFIKLRPSDECRVTNAECLPSAVKLFPRRVCVNQHRSKYFWFFIFFFSSQCNWEIDILFIIKLINWIRFAISVNATIPFMAEIQLKSDNFPVRLPVHFPFTI